MLGRKQGCGAPKPINWLQRSDSRFPELNEEKDNADLRNQAKRTKEKQLDLERRSLLPDLSVLE
jgi:hypothetical protein